MGTEYKPIITAQKAGTTGATSAVVVYAILQGIVLMRASAPGLVFWTEDQDPAAAMALISAVLAAVSAVRNWFKNRAKV